MVRTLVVYYSWSNWNTKCIAEKIQKATQGDIARIETVKPYTGSYNEVVDQGQREVNSGYEPPIKPIEFNIADYDVIAIGTPTWWYTMAPAVLTFLHSQNWTGKTVVPFMTNGGWPGHVIDDIKKACKGAEFTHEMEIRFDSSGGDRMESSENLITDWVSEIKNL